VSPSTLQIGGYHSYQHRKQQAAQVTITEPDSTVSAFRPLSLWAWDRPGILLEELSV